MESFVYPVYLCALYILWVTPTPLRTVFHCRFLPIFTVAELPDTLLISSVSGSCITNNRKCFGQFFWKGLLGEPVHHVRNVLRACWHAKVMSEHAMFQVLLQFWCRDWSDIGLYVFVWLWVMAPLVTKAVLYFLVTCWCISMCPYVQLVLIWVVLIRNGWSQSFSPLTSMVKKKAL